MGYESSASPSGKRSRDAEDEVYLDNFHAHKRYLSEVMASSLNGLSVGESLDGHLMESPARSEGMSNTRDEISLQYSPMSEDLDDARYIENPINTTAQVDSAAAIPVSPHRQQRPPNASSSAALTSSYPSIGSNLTTVNCSPSRPRGSDSENRLPSSPSDICHPGDLRRAALLRSVQMRTQPLCSPSVELPSCLGRETMQNIEAEAEQSCSCMGTLADERDYQNQEQGSNLFIEECSSMVMSESEIKQKNSCRALDMNVKGEEELVVERSGLVPSRRPLLGENSKSCVDSK